MGEDEAAVVATLRKLGLAATDLGSVSGTIARRPPDSAGPRLPSLSLEASDEGTSDLVSRGILGRGGMGVVHLAEQRSLGREVAVKTALAGDADVAHALLREARIMGGIEHPNVVPVHVLGVDADGAPVLVMKRIEGASWRAMLADPAHPTWALLLTGHGDRLRAQVEILAQVARALAFAHDRGVVHRDLKPENVMIGRFGEVYLLDWGVALRLSERDTEPAGIVGTPGYFSPEMATGDPHRTDARTDVYLLGATLYEVLAGHMPNEAPTALAALVVAVTGERPPLPADAPPELAQLVERAMALDPASRPEGAEAFRAGLARFLASREADALVRDARASMALAETAGTKSPEAYRALIEARFALTSALRARPDDASVRRDLDACLHKLVERELSFRSAEGALTHLAEIKEPTADLIRRIEQLEVDLADEARVADEGRRGRREADVSRVWRVMAWTTVALALTGVIVELVWPSARISRGNLRNVDVLGAYGALFAVGTAIATIARRAVFATAASRELLGFFLIWFCYPVVLAIVGLARGVQHFDGALSMAAGFAVAAVGTIGVLRELWPVLIVYVPCLVVLVAWPDREVGVHAALHISTALIIVRALRLRSLRARAGAPAR